MLGLLAYALSGIASEIVVEPRLVGRYVNAAWQCESVDAEVYERKAIDRLARPFAEAVSNAKPHLIHHVAGSGGLGGVDFLIRGAQSMLFFGLVSMASPIGTGMRRLTTSI